MSNRIGYIDTAKGLGMILIVSSHVDIPDPWAGAYDVRVMLFFVLSGFFFSSKLSPIEFLKKKVRTILIPFLLFWLLSYMLFYLGMYLMPGFETMTPAKGILDCFTQKEYFNGPLWFLLSLFFMQLIYYPADKYLNHDIYKMFYSLALGFVGYKLSTLTIPLPLNIDTALSCLPFFCFGSLIYRNKLLEKIDNTVAIVCTIVLTYFIFIANPISAYLSVNKFVNHFAEFFSVGFCLCISYILISKIIYSYTKVIGKFFSLVGYYSMYIMCTHHLFYRPIKYVILLFIDNYLGSVLVLILTLTLCLFTAPFVEKYAPLLIGKWAPRQTNNTSL